MGRDPEEYLAKLDVILGTMQNCYEWIPTPFIETKSVPDGYAISIDAMYQRVG